MTARSSSGVDQVVLARVLEALADLGDIEMQRRLWVHGSSTEMSDLNEVVSMLYDDSGLGDALLRRRQIFSIVIDDDLRRLDRHLRPYVAKWRDLSAAERALEIESENWSRLRVEAQRLLSEVQKFRLTD